MSGTDADRDEGGKYTETVTDDDVLAAMRRADAPVVTATELADRLPIGRSAVRERLLGLLDAGLVERKDVGARAVVWWIPSEVGGGTSETGAEDPFFSAPAFEGEPTDTDDIDDIVYGDIER